GSAEAHREARLSVAGRYIEGERLAVSEEVVCRIADADEAAAYSRRAARERDHLTTLLFHFNSDIDHAVALVGLELHVFFFDLVKIAELIESQTTQIEELLIVEIAFINEYLSAQDLIASDGISLKLYSANGERLAFLNYYCEIDGVGRFVEGLSQIGCGLNIARSTVEFAQPLEYAFPNDLR